MGGRQRAIRAGRPGPRWRPRRIIDGTPEMPDVALPAA